MYSEAEYQAVVAQRDSIAARLDAMANGSALAAAEAELATVLTRVDALKVDKADLQAKLDAVRADKADLQAKVAARDATIDGLKQDLAGALAAAGIDRAEPDDQPNVGALRHARKLGRVLRQLDAEALRRGEAEAKIEDLKRDKADLKARLDVVTADRDSRRDASAEIAAALRVRNELAALLDARCDKPRGHV